MHFQGAVPQPFEVRRAGVQNVGNVFLAFDVKAPRTDRQEDIADILRTSAANLERLWDRALKVDRKKILEFRKTQRYTALAGYLAECLY